MKSESVPPVTVTSPASKVVDSSLSVNVIVADSPLLSVALLLAMATVGATVSTEITGASVPAVLSLPAASVNRPAATDTVPLAVELAVGVNVAE